MSIVTGSAEHEAKDSPTKCFVRLRFLLLIPMCVMGSLRNALRPSGIEQP
jgi:hypothetical protein